MNTEQFEKHFTRFDAQEQERSIKISGTLAVWYESHPYGMGSAKEKMSEVTEVNIEVDDQPMTDEDFRTNFPGSDLDQLIEQASQ